MRRSNPGLKTWIDSSQKALLAMTTAPARHAYLNALYILRTVLPMSAGFHTEAWG